jgi:uncharacterized protein YciI
MNIFIAELKMITNDTKSEKFKKANEIHADYYQSLIPKGEFLLSGPAMTKDGKVDGGIFILKAKNRSQAEEIMSNDPMVKAGISQYYLKELQPMLINPILKNFLDKKEEK